MDDPSWLVVYQIGWPFARIDAGEIAALGVCRDL